MVQYWQLSSFNILNFNVNGVLNFYDIKIISRREDLIKNVNHSVDDEIRWKLQPVSCWWWSADGDSPPCCRSSLNVCGARDRSRLSPHRARVSPSHTQIPFTVRRTSGSVQFSLHLTAERLSETQRVGGQCEGPVRGPAGGGGEGAVPGQQADLPRLAPGLHLQDHQAELHLLQQMLWVATLTILWSWLTLSDIHTESEYYLNLKISLEDPISGDVKGYDTVAVIPPWNNCQRKDFYYIMMKK